MKFRLQFSVAALFAVLTMAILGVAVSLFYISNKNLAIETARSAMADAVAKTDTALLNFVAPVGRTVETMAALYAAFPEDPPPLEALRVVDSQISGLDQVYGAFVGMEADGAFHQVILLPESMKTFGPANRPVPDGATRVYRLIEQTEAGRAGGATGVVLEGAARIPLHGSVHAIYRKPTAGGLGWRADFQGKIE